MEECVRCELEESLSLTFNVNQELSIYQTWAFGDVGFGVYKGRQLCLLHPLSSWATPTRQIEQPYVC